MFGVTGLPCAGKSVAAQLLAEGVGTGVPGVLVKADDVGHQVLARPDVVKVLRDHFGKCVAEAETPAAMRQAIAAQVFSHPAELDWLEKLVHPLVRAETERIARENLPVRPVIVEAALLFAGGLDRLCETIVLVEANLDIRMVRAAARGWKPDELARREQRLSRLFTQKALAPYREKIIRVRNDSDDGQLADRLRAQLEARAWKKTSPA